MLWLLQPSFLLKWTAGFIVNAGFPILSDSFLQELIKQIRVLVVVVVVVVFFN